jgi:hypothetical protein
LSARNRVPITSPPSHFPNPVLVSCSRDSPQNLLVIPGNPGSQSGMARPGIQESQKLLNAGFHRHDGKGHAYFFSELRRYHTIVWCLPMRHIIPASFRLKISPSSLFSKEDLSPAENSPCRFVASCAPSAIAGVVRWETPDHFLLLLFSSLLESKYSGMIERCPESPFLAISGMGLFCQRAEHRASVENSSPKLLSCSTKRGIKPIRITCANMALRDPSSRERLVGLAQGGRSSFRVPARFEFNIFTFITNC